MSDSCRPWKLEPGLVVRYSMPSVFKTSTMKSPAGCSMIRDETCAGGAISAAAAAEGGISVPGRGATNAAAPAAALFRNPRRFTEPCLDFAIVGPPPGLYAARLHQVHVFLENAAVHDDVEPGAAGA